MKQRKGGTDLSGGHGPWVPGVTPLSRTRGADFADLQEGCRGGLGSGQRKGSLLRGTEEEGGGVLDNRYPRLFFVVQETKGRSLSSLDGTTPGTGGTGTSTREDPDGTTRPENLFPYTGPGRLFLRCVAPPSAGSLARPGSRTVFTTDTPSVRPLGRLYKLEGRPGRGPLLGPTPVTPTPNCSSRGPTRPCVRGGGTRGEKRTDDQPQTG